MRVSSNMIANMIKSDVNKQGAKLLRAQVVLSSQKKIQKPSDDPFAAERILKFRSDIDAMEQYDTNMTRAETRIKGGNEALDSIWDLLSMAREFAIQNNYDGAPAEQRAIAAETVKMAREQITQIANTQVDGDYLFAGHQTEDPPFTENAAGYVVYNGDEGIFDAIIGQDLTMQTNLTGGDLMTYTDVAGENVVDVLAALKDMEDALNAPIFSAASMDGWIDDIDAARDQIKLAQARSAARTYALDATRTQTKTFKAHIEDLLSGVEDADLAQAAVELKSQETVYETVLKASAMVIQPSLLDFIN